MRFTCLFTVILICFAGYSQNDAYKNLQNQFIHSYCDCLEEYKNTNPNELLFNRTDYCINTFFSNLDQVKTIELINSDTSLSDTLTQYERNYLWGSKLGLSIIEDLVTECNAYRQAINEFKTLMIKQFKLDETNLNDLISEFNTNLPKITDPKNKAFMSTLFGIIYEINNQPIEALKYYEIALQLNETTSTKGLKKIVELNQTNTNK